MTTFDGQRAAENIKGMFRMTRAKFSFVTGLLALLLAASAHAAVLKLATIAPEGSDWMNEHRAAAETIKARTDGRVTLKFYGGGVMGNDRKVLRKIRIGQLQGAAFTTSGLSERYPDIVLFGMPFVFRSQDEVDHVREKLDADLLQGLEEAGFVSFGFAGGGFANFMSRDPLRSQENLQGKKIWVPEGDVISFTALESMNLSPVVLPLSDVLTGLQTGLLDVIVTPPVGALLLQWYTKVQYINPLPVAYTLGLLAIDAKAFARIDAADQQVIREVMTDVYLRLDKTNRLDNIEAKEALLANGLKIVESTPDDIPYWRKIARETNEKIWKETAVRPELFEKLEQILSEYRATAEQPSAAESAM
jgi:TRAP-type C4-dicarboxylate transport system substrate-binding protein